ncbi:MAG: ADP-ribosylglycohydrolase family protein [Clostridiales bacterium]|nr:ADP-ribosylglycohydrolase family protein [Clostridiales bacterium]
MLGAIIGDIVGSIYEWDSIKTKDFPLFSDNCFFTDDTVMTVATADALMNGGKAEDFIDAFKNWGRRYDYVGYGYGFRNWLYSDDRSPYNSWGNGSAMRVSPCAWLMDCQAYARTGMWPSRELAKLSAEVTHNHPEGIKGALAVTDAIFLCRFYMGGYTQGLIVERATIEQCKLHVREHIEKEYGYDLSKTLDEIRPAYCFDASCQGTVPQAIMAFLESTDFEDAIRNAVSLGGDSDTLAAITGSIAEAAYGIPQWIKEKAWSYLDARIREVCRRWQAYIEKQGPSRYVPSDSQ